MHDVDFYIKSFNTKLKILKGEDIPGDMGKLFESFVAEKPKVFQVETTNLCNMRCSMCPRTNMMKRKIGFIKPELFRKVIGQFEPHSALKRLKWRQFVDLAISKSGILATDQDFFNFVISAEALTLHGFGEPLLDPHIAERVAECTARGIPTYFSCNPMNMTDELCQKLLDAGLCYLKYSMDGLDEATLEKFRGRKMSPQAIKDRIHKTIDMINKGGHSTIVVLTMIQFESNREQCEAFLKEWQDKNVFAYVKSSHNRWFFDEEVPSDKVSHYMRGYCEYPFMSMTVLYDGTVVPCSLDYDGIMPMGNVNEQSLEEIWHGEPFRKFREMHANGTLPRDHFCLTQCDLPVMGEVYKERRRLRCRP